MKIDYSELHKQMREKIVASGNYCELSIVIGGTKEEQTMPMAKLTVKTEDEDCIIHLITTVREIYNTFKKSHPKEWAMSELMATSKLEHIATEAIEEEEENEEM